MKLTYHANLKGNTKKLEKLDEQLYAVKVISRYYFLWIRKHHEYRKNEIHKATYDKIREHFPYLHSKLVQHTRDKVLSSVKDRKLFKVKKLNIPLVFDYQGFNLEFRDGYYGAFIKLLGINYPIEGLRTISKIRDLEIKEVQLRKLPDGSWRIYFSCSVPEPLIRNGKKFGIDVNISNVSLSNGKRINLKPFVHRKLEYKKNHQVRKVVNFSRNYVHTLTSSLIKYLVHEGGSSIILEDLTHIRKSSSRKNGTSKGKTLNYLMNNTFPFAMFQSFLEYKAKLNGLDVQFIDPRNTSKTCSKCGSMNTKRPKPDLFICNDCGMRMNADKNGAINILSFSTLNGDLIDSPASAPKIKQETPTL